MWSGVSERDDWVLWDIACPTQPSRVPGVTMAGFRDRGITPPGLRLIPHSAVTLVLVFGGTIAVEDATGRQHQGSFVTGLGFGESLRALRAEDLECLQVRLSPLAAHAVLGAAVANLDGAVVTLDDLWGREAARISEHLGDLSSWEDRFALTDAWLARRYAAASQVAPEVAWAWRGIVPAVAWSGSSTWRPNSAGAANACGPGSIRRSACRPSAPRGWSAWTMPSMAAR